MSYPMKMLPAFKDYIWGGERLVSDYHKRTSMRPVAESWEISCHPHGLSKVANGEHINKTLKRVLADNPMLAGSRYTGKDFPILIKLIDAQQDLSVQVHPDDTYAQKHENQSGKNECWYVLEANEDARVLIGCKEKMQRNELNQYIVEGTLISHLNTIQVKSGDFFNVSAGMLHTIGSGCLIAEVQQSSDITYRVYDYDRTDHNGKQREFHVDKALDVINTTLKESRQKPRKKTRMDGYTKTNLTDWQYFSLDLLEIETSAELISANSEFQCFVTLDGNMSISHNKSALNLHKGESVFIPAGIGRFVVNGKCKALRVIV
jgi:mannose-6-phosphate isomerase